MKTNKTRSIYVYTCTIYTYMHHQIPPKYNIYLVGLPSVLYETPGHNERSVLNQMFLLLFSEKCNGFQWKVQLVKSAVLVKSAFQWNLGHMVLKGVNWVYTMIKLGQMVLKGVNYTIKIGPNGLERSQLGTLIQKWGDMVLKVVNWVQNDKISSNGLERNQLGTQHKNQVIWSWKESNWYSMIKLGYIILKGVKCELNNKIRSNGLERSHLDTQW